MLDWVSNLSPYAVFRMGKDMLGAAINLIKRRNSKPIIEFSDSSPFRTYEHDALGFHAQHYAIGLRAGTSRITSVRVMLTAINYAHRILPLPIELRYRDRSPYRHELNPGTYASIDVLSFVISVDRKSPGFWIDFHGDDEQEHRISCENCRIRVEVSAHDIQTISKEFEVGIIGGKTFFMRPSSQ